MRITSASFGPFDNAFLMIGLSNGIMLGLDFPTLDIVIEEQVFKDLSIDHIAFEPAHSIIVASK